MKETLKNIVIIGTGAIGTAIGQVLTLKKELKVTLLSIEPDVVESINNLNINSQYFPLVKLNSNLIATIDKSVLQDADVIFLAIPSSQVCKYVEENQNYFHPDVILVNLAKGFGIGTRTITEFLKNNFPFRICSMKGPSFARDIINQIPTGFTLASNEKDFFLFTELVDKTSIFLDYSTDIEGVELLSILKNIYAISIGIVDAHFDSPNLRFLVLTKAFKEMKSLLLEFGGQEETVFKYCGLGDFALTALNDLSRNRTLGLLIGKGFFTENISDKVLLEGRISVKVFHEKINSHDFKDGDFPILQEIYKVFNEENRINEFVSRILN